MSTCVAALYAAAGGPPASGTPAQQLVDDWASGGAGSDGFAMVFEDAGGTDAPSIYVKDSGTPANDTDINLTDDFDAFNSFLTYTSPSPKIVRQSDGNLKYCAHNLVDYSQDFTQWGDSGANTSISSDADTDPDGYAADALIADATGSAVRRIQKGVTNINGSFPASMSVVAKAGSANHLRMTSNFVQDVWFNLSTGAVGTEQDGGTGSIEDLGGGWYRCTMHAASGFSSATMYLNPSDTDAGFNTNVTDTANPVMYFSQAHGYLTPAVTTHLETTGSARYALPIQHDSSNNAEGLLVEPAATNLLVYSRNFSNAAYTKGNITVTADQSTGIDGLTSMDRLEASATTTTTTQIFDGITLAAGTTAAFSVYAKADEQQYLQIGYAAGSIDWFSCHYDLSDGTFASQTGSNGTVSSIYTESLGGGIYRCVAVGSVSGAANGNASLRFVSSKTPTLGSFGAESFSSTAGNGLFVDQFQVELGSSPTSPIITTGATATRAVDDLNKALTAIEHSATAGTLYAKYVPRGVATSRDIVRLDDGTANEVISIGQTSGAAARLTVTDGGAAQTAPLTSGTVVAAADNKVAASWAANDFAISEGGAAASTDTSGTLPTVTTFDVGAVNGLVKEVLHLPEAMSDGDLASITT